MSSTGAFRQRASGALAEAQVTLSKLQTKLRAEPRLADLHRRAGAELAPSTPSLPRRSITPPTALG